MNKELKIGELKRSGTAHELNLFAYRIKKLQWELEASNNYMERVSLLVEINEKTELWEKAKKETVCNCDHYYNHICDLCLIEMSNKEASKE